MKHKNFKKKRMQKALNIKRSKEKGKKNSESIIGRLRIEIIDNPVKVALDRYEQESPIIDKCGPAFLERIALNYIRHELTNYDNILLNFCGKTDYNRYHFKEDTNKKILEMYNNFMGEIEYDR